MGYQELVNEILNAGPQDQITVPYDTRKFVEEIYEFIELKKFLAMPADEIRARIAVKLYQFMEEMEEPEDDNELWAEHQELKQRWADLIEQRERDKHRE
jgi:hypothetical protein